MESNAVSFSYGQPTISRVYPEEPYDCATPISTVFFGGKHVDGTTLFP